MKGFGNIGRKEHQAVTHGIKNCRDSSKFKDCSPLQNRNGLIGLKSAIAYFAYTYRYMKLWFGTTLNISNHCPLI